MKKTLGVVAAAALAATPVLTFAAEDVTTHTDNIWVNVGTVCTLGGVVDGVSTGVDATTHTNGTDGIGTWTTDATNTDTLVGTMAAGTRNLNFGKSTFEIKCNNLSGYTVSVIGAGVASHEAELYNASGTATDNKNIIASTAAEPATTASSWAFKVDTTVEKSDLSTPIVSGYTGWSQIPTTSAGAKEIVSQDKASSLTSGDIYNVTYGVGIAEEQESGSYKGAVKYVLAQAD